MTRAHLAVALVLVGGCGLDLTGGGVWTPVEAIDGPLHPEVSGPPDRMVASRRQVALDPLRVVSYNVATGIDVGGLARAMQQDVDLGRAGVFLLQELESYPDEPGSRASQLAARLGLAYAYLPAREKNGGTHGLAILSAFPLEDLEVMELAQAPGPIGGAKRIAVEFDLVVGSRRLHLVDLHLDTTLNIDERLVELRPAVIDQPADVVIAGDFNTNDYAWGNDELPLLPIGAAVDTRQAPVVDQFMTALGFATPTAGLGGTEVHLGLESRLDSIYVRGLATSGAAVVRRVTVSDHWPLSIDVALP